MYSTRLWVLFCLDRFHFVLGSMGNKKTVFRQHLWLCNTICYYTKCFQFAPCYIKLLGLLHCCIKLIKHLIWCFFKPWSILKRLKTNVQTPNFLIIIIMLVHPDLYLSHIFSHIHKRVKPWNTTIFFTECGQSILFFALLLFPPPPHFIKVSRARLPFFPKVFLLYIYLIKACNIMFI